MNFLKSKAFGWIGLLVSILVSVSSVYLLYLSKIPLGLLAGVISVSVLTYISFSEEHESANALSYLFLVLEVLLVVLFLFNRSINELPNSLSAEKTYLFVATIGLFGLFVITYLIQSKGVWQKILGITTILLLLATITATAFVPPHFYNYIKLALVTKIFVPVFFFAIIFKKGAWAKVFGILGTLLGLVVIGVSIFIGMMRPYKIPGNDVGKIVEVINPKAQEFIKDYNEKDFDSILDSVVDAAKPQLEENLDNFKAIRDSYGKYVSHSDVEVVYLNRQFVVQYKTTFSNLEEGYMIFGINKLESDMKLSTLVVSNTTMLSAE